MVFVTVIAVLTDYEDRRRIALGVVKILALSRTAGRAGLTALRSWMNKA